MWQKLSTEVTNPRRRRDGLRVRPSLTSLLLLYYKYSHQDHHQQPPPTPWGHQDSQRLPPLPTPASQVTSNIIRAGPSLSIPSSPSHHHTLLRYDPTPTMDTITPRHHLDHDHIPFLPPAPAAIIPCQHWTPNCLDFDTSSECNSLSFWGTQFLCL